MKIIFGIPFRHSPSYPRSLMVQRFLSISKRPWTLEKTLRTPKNAIERPLIKRTLWKPLERKRRQ
jgi:hypothetical protein